MALDVNIKSECRSGDENVERLFGGGKRLANRTRNR
jgi:hypothetical protein